MVSAAVGALALAVMLSACGLLDQDTALVTENDDQAAVDGSGDGVDASQTEPPSENAEERPVLDVGGSEGVDQNADGVNQPTGDGTVPGSTGEPSEPLGPGSDEADTTVGDVDQSGPDAADVGLDDSQVGRSVVDPAILANTGEGLQGEALKSYIADRYEAFWTAFDAARANPSADPIAAHPDLAELASGDQLELALTGVDELRATGERITESSSPAIPGTDSDSEHRVAVKLIDDGLAEVTACVVNDDVRVNASGEVVSGGAITVLSRGTMVRTDNTWKLIRSQAIDITDGVGGCWDDPVYAY